jgi:uncharacterized membrane protein YgcG
LGVGEKMNKLIKLQSLLITVLIALFSVVPTDLVRAQGVPPTAQSEAEICKNKKVAADNAVSNLTKKAEDGGELFIPDGSDAFKLCVRLSKHNFKTIHTSKHNPDFTWKKVVEASDPCKDEIPECKTSATAQSSGATTAVSACENLKITATRCDAAAYMINVGFERDWDSDAIKSVGANRNQNQAAGSNNYGCKSLGIETVDYEPCVKFQNNSQNIEIAKAGVQQVGNVWLQAKSLETLTEASKDMQQGNSATAAQKGLLAGTENQKKLVETTAVMDTAKAAYYANMYNDMPTISTLEDRCKGWDPSNAQMEGLLSEQQKENLRQRVCNVITKATSGFKIGFLENGQARENMKAALVKAGLDVLNDALMAKLLADRAKDIKNSIANIDSFKPIDPIAPQQDDALMAFCQVQANANDPKCILPELGRTTDLMNDNVINFGSTGAGTSYKDKSTNPFTGDTSKAVGGTANRVIGGVGSSIANNQEKSGIENPAAAASIKSGGGPAPGGAAGGGSAGGGGGGGGGSSGGGPGGPGSPTMAAITKAKYDGGAGFSILGGSGLNGKSKSGGKDDSNPFGKLFNKGDKSGNVLNFRDLASQKLGSKSDNIFEMISRKYGEVNNEKRLLEYEMSK